MPTFGRLIALAFIRAKFKILAAISKKKAARSALDLFCTPPTRDIRELPELFQQAEEIRLDFDNHHVVGYRWNHGAGKKVLVNHGFESTAINFVAYVAPLLKKGFEVILFDAPAHGRSPGKRINTIIYRDMIKAIDARFGPIRNFVGHSLGGLSVSLAMAEIPHDRDCKLVLMAPAANTSTAIDNFFRLLRLPVSLKPWFISELEDRGGHPLSWFMISRALEQVKAQVLWLHDEDDQVTPVRDARAVEAKQFPNIRFVYTHGFGHSRIYREQSVIDEVVRFL